MQLWTLVQPLVTWRHPDRVWRLFAVACLVQAALAKRYPGYQPASVYTVPLALVNDVKEMLDVLVRRDRDWRVSADASAAPRATRGL